MACSHPDSSRSTDLCFGSLPWLSIVRDSPGTLSPAASFTHTQVDRNVNENFKFNQETEFVPILGQIADKLNEDNVHKTTPLASSIQENHHPALLSLLAGELNVSPKEIHDFEL